MTENRAECASDYTRSGHGLGSTWDFLWHFLIIFAWIAYLLVLFQILGDLFRRDHKTSGWVKAIWVAFLILFPCITALIYLIARGKGMAERAQEAAAGAKKEADDYIRQAAGRSPVQEIADAKALLEAGTITQAEFESQKAKSLSWRPRTVGRIRPSGGSAPRQPQTGASETVCRTIECRLDAPIGHRYRSS